MTEEHWMPQKKKQYVIGVPYEIVEIDPEKSKKIDRDRFYEFHNNGRKK